MLGRVFSVPLPRVIIPRPFLPALVLPRSARPLWTGLPIHERLRSLFTHGWLPSTRITSYHFCRPSWPTQYEFRTSMLGCRLEARSSVILWILLPAVMRFTPIRAVLRARTYRDRLRPPRRTFTRTTIMPCFALYPRLRARSIRVGWSTRTTLPSRLQTCMRSHWRALTGESSGFFHASRTYAYIDFDMIFTKVQLI